MIDFEVKPGVGVGPVRLGMSLEEARACMPEDRESFKKSAEDLYETDGWHQAGFQVFYAGSPARVCFIELSRDCGFEATCFGVKVFSRPAEEVVNRLAEHAALDLNNPDLGCSYIFPSLELALWRPFMPESADDEGHSFSTIGIGEVGYYSSAR